MDSKINFSKTKDYCTLSPDSIFGVYIGDCCRIHDYHYQKYDKELTRKQADKLFLDMLKFKLNKWYNHWISYTYYFAVRLIFKASWERWNYNWFFFGLIPMRKNG